jgi:hypothetical protein
MTVEEKQGPSLGHTADSQMPYDLGSLHVTLCDQEAPQHLFQFGKISV